MKKMISFILAAAMSAMVAIPALAADPTTTKDASGNTWTTAGENEDYADKMMTMVAYEGGEITVDSIQYIDQTTADANGAYSFSGYAPKTLPGAGVTYDVKVGGETLATALDAGEIVGEGSSDVAVTGAVKVQGSARAVEVAFYAPDADPTKDAPIYGGDLTNGALDLAVAPGTYDVVFSSPGYLSYTITDVIVEDALALGEIALVLGDVDSDAAVTVTDIGIVVAAYGATSADEKYDISRDFDNDTNITVTDIGMVVASYGAKAPVIAFADLNK